MSYSLVFDNYAVMSPQDYCMSYTPITENQAIIYIYYHLNFVVVTSKLAIICICKVHLISQQLFALSVLQKEMNGLIIKALYSQNGRFFVTQGTISNGIMDMLCNLSQRDKGSSSNRVPSQSEK